MIAYTTFVTILTTSLFFMANQTYENEPLTFDTEYEFKAYMIVNLAATAVFIVVKIYVYRMLLRLLKTYLSQIQKVLNSTLCI